MTGSGGTAGRRLDRWRGGLYDLIMDPTRPGRGALWFDVGMTGVLLVNLVAVVLETVPWVLDRYGPLLRAVDTLTILLITLDFGVRVWLCVEEPRYSRSGRVAGRLRYLVTPMALIDLAAIAPWWLSLVFGFDLRFLIVLRLLRLLKLVRYSPAVGTVLTVLAREWRPLAAAVVVILAALVLVAGGMYRIEGARQPAVFGSIPDAMWWAVVSFTRLGAAPMEPATPAGQLFAGLSGLLGLMATALPGGILASAFVREFRRQDFVVSWRVVARVPFFRDVDADTIAEITTHLETTTVTPNSVIVRRDRPGDRVYFLVEGRARVEAPDGEVVLSEGDFFGEMALLFAENRTATVIADTECRLLYLERDVFTRLLRRNAALRRAVRRVVRERLDANGWTGMPAVLAETEGADDAAAPGKDQNGGSSGGAG